MIETGNWLKGVDAGMDARNWKTDAGIVLTPVSGFKLPASIQVSIPINQLPDSLI